MCPFQISRSFSAFVRQYLRHEGQCLHVTKGLSRVDGSLEQRSVLKVVRKAEMKDSAERSFC